MPRIAGRQAEIIAPAIAAIAQPRVKNRRNVAYWPKADTLTANRRGSFWVESGHQELDQSRELMTRSGHRAGCQFVPQQALGCFRELNGSRAPLLKPMTDDSAATGALVKRRYMLSVMCWRFTYKLTWEEILRLYRLTLDQPAQNTQARYNVCPTTTVDTIVGSDGKRGLVLGQSRSRI
jgi:hypothetical protein